MSGKVIQTLRCSPLATYLSEAELRMLAGCGRIYQYDTSQNIVSAGDQDERLFLLRDGKVDLHLIINAETGQCSGEVHVELSSPGEPFGWAAWMRPNKVEISAQASGPVSVISFNLARLGDTGTFLKLSQMMLKLLYARLQEFGLCPPIVQTLLKMKHLLQS